MTAWDYLSNPIALLAGIGIFLAVIVFAASLIRDSRATSGTKRIAKLLANYGGVKGAGEVAEVKKETKPTWLSEKLKAYQLKMEQYFFSAGLRLTIQLWFALQVGTAFALFILATAFFHNSTVALLIGIAGGYLVPRQMVKSRSYKRGVKFNEELPQVLQVLASGLRSGLSFAQALAVVAEQDKGEVGTQFRQALTEVEYGSDLEEALLRVADRMHSVDLKWLVSALDIQREVGGSLSGILDSVAETIRGRAEVYREVQVLSAEGRLSAYVLLALPILILIVLSIIQPSYVQFFWTDPMGFVLMGAFILLVTVGWFWLKKIVRVEV